MNSTYDIGAQLAHLGQISSVEDLDQALHGLETHLAINPADHEVRLTLAKFYLILGKHESASKELLVLSKNLSEIRNFLVEIGLLIIKTHREFPSDSAICEAYNEFTDFKSSIINNIKGFCESPQAHTEFHETLSSMENYKAKLEEQYHQKAFRNHVPILFLGLGHSAGTYITYELGRRLGMHLWSEPLTVGVSYDVNLREEILQKIIKFGGIAHSHMNLNKYNQSVLLHSGIKKMVVHVRDPRQSLYSNVHWVHEVRRIYASDDTNSHSKYIFEEYIGEEFFSKSFSEQVDWMIETMMPTFAEWFTNVLRFVEKAAGTIEVKITLWEDFKKNSSQFYKDILDFYGIPHSELHGEEAICQPKPDGRPGDFAYRKSSPDEWKSEMNTEQKARCLELFPEELLRQFGYSPT